MKKTLSLVASGAAVTVLLSGCGLANILDPAREGSLGEETVSAELLPYYEQDIVWDDCENGMECATLSAPMDWSNPSPETDIELSLVRQPASGFSRKGSLFVNPGGLGASGADFVYDNVGFAASEDLQESFDIIGWDPRGVGSSTSISCGRGYAALDELIFSGQTSVDEVTQDAIAFGQACSEGTGEFLQFLDILSNVKDLDMMRAVVGDEKLNYLGYSLYGSDLAALYIENFPRNVGRLVVDGATDPSLSPEEISLTESAISQGTLESFLEECPELFDDCPFTGDKAADLATVRGLFDRYYASPVAGPDGRMMGGSVLDSAVNSALDPGVWQYLNDLFIEVMAGETLMAFTLAEAYYGRDSEGSYATEASFAIYCASYPLERDQAALVEYERKRQEASPTSYSPLPFPGEAVCRNWPYQHEGPATTALTGAGAPPVLVVATTGDTVAPYEWGVSLANQLESAQLITFNGDRHTAYGQGSDCVTVAVDDYFIGGVVPDSDPDC